MTAAPPKPALFAKIPDDQLLSYGVPPEWLNDVRRADEDSLLQLADHLPAEAAEALLDLATGTKPKLAVPATAGQNPFEHPDAQRRFRVMSNVEEMERALNSPWEKWTVFLHPAQRRMVERGYNGPARVAGSAGTGKTIVALHRAVHLARMNPNARVLLTTFSDTLCHALTTKLRSLDRGDRIEVHSMNGIGRRLYESRFGPAQIASRETVADTLRDAADGAKFSIHFLYTEWGQIVDAWR